MVLRASTWRELYGIRPAEETVEDATKRTLDAWLAPKLVGKTPAQAGWEAWMSDQRIVTERLCRADWFPQEALLIERRGHPPVDRLDRGAPADWEHIDVSKYTDAHIMRAPDQPAQWAQLRQLVAALLPQHLAWADDYAERYRRSYTP